MRFVDFVMSLRVDEDLLAVLRLMLSHETDPSLAGALFSLR